MKSFTLIMTDLSWFHVYLGMSVVGAATGWVGFLFLCLYPVTEMQTMVLFTPSLLGSLFTVLHCLHWRQLLEMEGLSSHTCKLLSYLGLICVLISTITYIFVTFTLANHGHVIQAVWAAVTGIIWGTPCFYFSRRYRQASLLADETTQLLYDDCTVRYV